MPNPPCERLSEPVHLREQREQHRHHVGRDADPGVAIGHGHALRGGPDRQHTRPPGSVNFAALFRMLLNTCVSRTRSPVSFDRLGRDVVRSASVRLLELRPAHVQRRFHHFLNRERSGVSRSLPVVIRDTSSRSSTRRTSCATCRSRRSRWRRTASPVSLARRRISSALRIGASGLRSSCASVARNSSFRRSASRSAALAGPVPPCALHLRSNSAAAAAGRWRTGGAVEQRRRQPGLLQVVAAPASSASTSVREWPCPVNRMTGPERPRVRVSRNRSMPVLARAGNRPGTRRARRRRPPRRRRRTPASSRGGIARRGCRRGVRG